MTEIRRFAHRAAFTRVALLLSMCLVPAAPLPAAETSRVLADFETVQEAASWNPQGLPSKVLAEHVTHGASALRIEFGGGEYPGISREFAAEDWSGFEAFRADVFSPADTPVPYCIRIDDADSTDYGSRFNGDFVLAPGENRIDLPLTGLRTGDRKRDLDLRRIRRLILFTSRLRSPVTLYFDHLRLVREDLTPGFAPFWNFDFGPSDAPVFPGFAAVTPETLYTKERGFGFLRPGANFRDRKHPDELAGDWVEGRSPFRLDAPNGEYEVWLMMEDAGYWEWYPHFRRRTVTANGKTVVEEENDPRSFFRDKFHRHLDTEDSPGTDVWQTYIVPRYRPHVFPVVVKEGWIELGFDPPGGQVCTPSALVVYPMTNQAEGRRWLADLDRRRRDRFRQAWQEVPHPPRGAAPPPLTKVVPAPVGVAAVDPNAPPYPSDRVMGEPDPKQLSVTGCPGETVDTALAVWPREPTTWYTVTVSDLEGDRAGRIPSAAVRVRWVEYKIKRLGAASRTYEVRPELLRDPPIHGTSIGVPRSFRLTLTIPDGTPAGRYGGTVRVSPAAAGTFTVPLVCTVRSFALEEIRNRALGMYSYHPSFYEWFDETRPKAAENLALCLADQRTHGMTSVGAFEDLEALPAFLAAYRQAGFAGTLSLMPGGNGSMSRDMRSYQALIAGARDACAKAGVPVALNLLDEPSNVDGIGRLRGLELVQWARGVSGVALSGDINHSGDEVFFECLTHPCFNDGLGISGETIGRARAAGADPWLYNCGKDRLSWGWYLDKMDIRGRFEFAYQVGQVDPFYDLDARESDINAAYPGPEGPIASIWWERIRDGVTDLRYATTFRARVEEAVRQEKDVRRQARARELLSAYESELKSIDDRLSANRAFDDAACARLREKVARWIEELGE